MRTSLLIFLVGLAACGPTSADLAALHEESRALRSGAEEAIDAWRLGIGAWADRDAHEGEVCPLEALDPERVGAVATSAIGETAPAYLDALVQSADVLEAQVLLGPGADGVATIEQGLRAAEGALRGAGVDVLFVLHEQGTPSFRSGALTPGVLRGWLLAYDFSEQRVVCAGRVHATNRPDVLQRIERDDALAERFAVEPDAVLLDDLFDAAWEQGIEGFTRVDS